MAAGAVEVNVTTNNFKPCAVFDGVDDYVEVAHNANQLGANLASGFTISAWVNPRSLGESSLGSVFNKSTGTSGNGGWWYQMASTNRIGLRIDGGTGINSANNACPNNTWTHTLVTVTAAGIQNLYINGVISAENVDAAKTMADIDTTNAPRIGNRATATDRTFDGGIAKVKMWNKVLSAAEIALDYAGSPVNDGLILDVPLDSVDPAGNYIDNKGNAVTNSGSYLSIVDDAISAAIKADRTTANDKYLMVGMPGGQVVSAVIEEAP